MWDLITVILVVSPIVPPVPHRAPDTMWRPLKKLALQLEIVGPHERWANDFHSELNYVRRHWRELQDAPPLDECGRLPPVEVTTAYCRLNWAYQECLKARRGVCRLMRWIRQPLIAG